MKYKYTKFNELLNKGCVATISPSLKIKSYDIIETGTTPVISQDREFINGYTNLIDEKLCDIPYIVFGDHTEILKWIDFSFVQGADGIKILKVKDKKIDDKFLYYALLNNYYKTGFYQRHFKLLKKTYIPDLPLNYQKKVASILDNYDCLIDINNKRIKILESVAESTFKEWFIRFRYPSRGLIKFKKSKIGNIPGEFNLVPFSKLFSDYSGGGWGNDYKNETYSEPGYVIRGADFPFVMKGDLSTLPYRYHKKSNIKTRLLYENDLIIEISGGTEEQPVGRSLLVTQTMLDQLEHKVIAASFCKRVKPNFNEITINYLYYWLRYMHKTRMLDRFQLQSTGISNFKFEYFIRKGECLVPPKILMDKFEEFMAPIRLEIDMLSNLNKNLKIQRDLLLPRLISGKLDIINKKV